MDGKKRMHALIIGETNGPSPGLSRSETGVIVAYRDRSYADQTARAMLAQLRRHLPPTEYCEALPAQIMESCKEIRQRAAAFGLTTRLELSGSFDLGKQSIRFRVLSLMPNRPGDRAALLVLLNVMWNDTGRQLLFDNRCFQEGGQA
jgi:hypothetical protein